MKPLFSRWAALMLLAPLSLIVALLILPLGCGGGGGAGPTPTPIMGLVEAAFTDSPSDSFQQLVLNVLEIRLNPSTDPNVSESDPNWQVVAVPAGLGAIGEVQIDLTPLQNEAKLFNTVAVPAQTYNQAELLLDNGLPAVVVPNCSKVAPTTGQPGQPPEGCISYNAFVRGNTRFTIPGGLLVTSGATTPLILDITPQQPPNGTVPPSTTGGFYTVNVNVTAAPNLANLLGTVSGTLAGPPANTLTSFIVSAEPTGTDNVIATTRVLGDGSFRMTLPAIAPAPSPGPSGTDYDLFVSSGIASIDAASRVTVKRGSSTPPVSFNSTASGQNLGSVSGTVTQKTNGAPIQGATVDLQLASDQGVKGALVAVRSTFTDMQGKYSIGSIPFSSGGTVYTIRISASGFDTFSPSVTVNNASASSVCMNSTTSTDCSAKLTNNTIGGTVLIDSPAPSNTTVQVLVIAEDTGTNTIESVTNAFIPSGQTSATFTLNVPTMMSKFDLFASAVDLFKGAPDPFTGHTIAVQSGVAGGASQVALSTLGCVGHGNIVGNVSNSDSVTTVRVSKSDSSGTAVQLFESTVGQATGASGKFSFCVPPDSYTAQRYENGSAVPSAMPVMVPAPAATSTGCPTTCFLNGSTTMCPGPCGPSSTAQVNF